MKRNIAKVIAGAALVLVAVSSAAYAGFVYDIGQDAGNAAKGTWHFTERTANTAVHLPAYAYRGVMGEPIHRQTTVVTTHTTGPREHVALAGHRRSMQGKETSQQ